MLLKKRHCFWKIKIILINTIVLFIVSGCSTQQAKTPFETESISQTQIPYQAEDKETGHGSCLTEEGLDSKKATEKINTEISTKSEYFMIPQAKDCLISNEEKEQLQKDALWAAGLVSGIDKVTEEGQKHIVEELGKNGFISVGRDINMQNGKEIETFYADYLNGKDTMVTVFEIQKDGIIGATTFIYRQNKLQAYYIGIEEKGGTVKLQGTSISDVSEIRLTEKGYFIYTYKEIIAHAGLRQYWRTSPLSDLCRELTKKYITGLSYVNYNMLVADWDSSNVEDILMPCMYEDIYRIYTGKNLRTKNWEIPAEEYEKIMTTYFPVSIEQVQKCCGYMEESDSYPYEMIYASPYPPFGEVIDYTENADGTITLIVDGVWPDYNSDCAFTNKIVVQPFDNGTFQYLSNKVEQKEMELPVIVK